MSAREEFLGPTSPPKHRNPCRGKRALLCQTCTLLLWSVLVDRAALRADVTVLSVDTEPASRADVTVLSVDTEPASRADVTVLSVDTEPASRADVTMLSVDTGVTVLSKSNRSSSGKEWKKPQGESALLSTLICCAAFSPVQ